MHKDTDAILLRSMQLATIFEWMETNKLCKLSVDFNGEGDSGDFDDHVSIDYIDHEKYSLSDYVRLQEEIQSKIGEYKPTLGGMEKGHNTERTLNQLVVHLARNVEKETEHGVDWWNNDGGNGTVEFILDGVGLDGNTYHHGICLTVNERTVAYESHHHSVDGLVE